MDKRVGNRRDERGSSLLEVLVALLLLALMVMGLAASLPLALRGVAFAGRQGTLTLLAQQAAEIVREARPEALAALDSGGFVEVLGHPGLVRSIAVAWGIPTAGTATVTVVTRGLAADGSGEAALTTVVGP